MNTRTQWAADPGTDVRTVLGAVAAGNVRLSERYASVPTSRPTTRAAQPLRSNLRPVHEFDSATNSPEEAQRQEAARWFDQLRLGTPYNPANWESGWRDASGQLAQVDPPVVTIDDHTTPFSGSLTSEEYLEYAERVAAEAREARRAFGFVPRDESRLSKRPTISQPQTAPPQIPQGPVRRLILRRSPEQVEEAT